LRDFGVIIESFFVLFPVVVNIIVMHISEEKKLRKMLEARHSEMRRKGAHKKT